MQKYLANLKWDAKGLLARVAALSDEELKLLTRDSLRYMTNSLAELLLASKETSKPKVYADRLQLGVLLRLLHSDILEKRINALLEMQDLLRHLRLCPAKP